MRNLSIALALGLLAGCGSEQSSRTGESEPQQRSRADSATESTNAATEPAPDPSNAAAARQIEDAQWFTKRNERGPWAGYGPPFSEAAFSVRCEGGNLTFDTTEMPPTGPGATQMRLSGEGFAQTLNAIADEQGLPNTSATVSADAEWLRRLLSMTGDLTVRVGGSDPLEVPMADPLRSLIRDCRS